MNASTHAASSIPDHAYFENLDAFSSRHWWHRARRELASEALRTARAPMDVAVDAGCGIGTMLPVLTELGARTVVGVEPSMDALTYAVQRAVRGCGLVCGRGERLPLKDSSVSTLTSMDVVEHIADEHAVLSEYARVVLPGGLVMLQVPAYRWLWSSHDELVGHVRRYSAGELVKATRRAGLIVERVTYYNAWLLPLAALVRRTPLQRFVRDSGEGASYVNPLMNRVFLALCRAERALLRFLRLPFGVSVLLIARKPPTMTGSALIDAPRP